MKDRVFETTITYLALSSPPAHLPPMPLLPRLALMKAENIPLHYYRYLYRTIGEEWLWIERLFLADEALAAKIRKPGVEVFVLYANGSSGGYFELDFSRPRRANLVYFGLMPEWTGMKIGPWLLGCAISEAFSRGVDVLTVNTCTFDHPAALPLYQRLGFNPVRREQRRVTVPESVRVPSHIAAGISP